MYNYPTIWEKICRRLQSPAVWASSLALFAFVLKTWLHIEVPGWDQFVTLFMAALVAFGIVSNPDNPSGF